MRILLDSHVALWWASDPQQLNEDCLALISDPSTDAFVSIASAWELAIKAAQGRLDVDVRLLFAGLARDNVPTVGIGVGDVHTATTLTWTHRDPFDRMLVAQAVRSVSALVTRDQRIIDAGLVATIAA